MKNVRIFLSENFLFFFVVKFPIHLNTHGFVMNCQYKMYVVDTHTCKYKSESTVTRILSFYTYFRVILVHEFRSTAYPFIPEFLRWTLPYLTLGISIVASRGLSQTLNGKHCWSWWDGSWRAVIWICTGLLGRRNAYPVSILRKYISGRHRPVREADGPMTARCRFT